MSLWDWTLRAYAQPGVPEACLDLQDRHGQNTSLLLWAVWAEAADPALLARAAAVAHDGHNHHCGYTAVAVVGVARRSDCGPSPPTPPRQRPLARPRPVGR